MVFWFTLNGLNGSEMTSDQIASRNAADMRSFATHKLSGLYTIIVVVVGLVFSLASSLTHQLEQETFYLEVFNVYIYSASILFLAYIHILLRKRTPGNNDVTRSKDSSVNSELYDSTTTVTSHITYDAPGVNFYLRLGAIGFGMGCLMQDGFRLALYIENSERSLHCLGPLYIVTVLLHMTFTFYQTYFIFKSHKIVVQTHKASVRVGLMHLVATNICVWFATTVTETQQDFLQTFRHSTHHEHYDYSPGSRLEHVANASLTHDVTQPRNESEFELCCTSESSLAWRASPYLFPCTIEYSLIVAAVAYKMYRNVGRSAASFQHHHHHQLAHHHLQHAHEHITATGVDCDKANKGLFVGLFVTVLTLVSVSCYFMFDNSSVPGIEASSLTFFATEILLLFLLSACVVLAVHRFQRLRFVRHTDSGLDESLLIVAVFGVFVLESFHLVSALATVGAAGLVSVLAAGTSLLAFTQAGIQTAFILDALHRAASTPDQCRLKPGRALVTFLLLANLSLWIVCIFEVQKAENLPIHASFYGYLPWSIISHLSVPMIIFYRFHSTVCLSDIWINAYQLQHADAPTIITVTELGAAHGQPDDCMHRL